jgi:LPS O-antigen subunit length determinant protein (WzzB/FepE family)
LVTKSYLKGKMQNSCSKLALREDKLDFKKKAYEPKMPKLKDRRISRLKKESKLAGEKNENQLSKIIFHKDC